MTTFFIIGSTVKLAILARKEEIEIMQLVGASEAMIQAPFVLEGMIQGVTGAVLSIAVLWFMFRVLSDEIASLGLFGLLNPLQFLDMQNMALIIAMGWLLGAAGSLFSLRRFIKTWRS